MSELEYMGCFYEQTRSLSATLVLHGDVDSICGDATACNICKRWGEIEHDERSTKSVA